MRRGFARGPTRGGFSVPDTATRLQAWEEPVDVRAAFSVVGPGTSPAVAVWPAGETGRWAKGKGTLKPCGTTRLRGTSNTSCAVRHPLGDGPAGRLPPSKKRGSRKQGRETRAAAGGSRKLEFSPRHGTKRYPAQGAWRQGGGPVQFGRAGRSAHPGRRAGAGFSGKSGGA